MTLRASELALMISTRVSNVLIANGFATDIGTRVFRGRMSLNKEDLPCVVIVEGDDTVQDAKNSLIKVAQQYVIEGHDECDPEQPNDKAHLILQDLKRAIFAEDRTFGGEIKRDDLVYLGRAIGARADGTSICAASISIQVEFTEDLANP